MSSSLNTTNEEESLFVANKQIVENYLGFFNNLMINSCKVSTPLTNLPLTSVKNDTLHNDKIDDFLYKVINKTQIEDSTLIYSLIYFEKIVTFDIVNRENSLLFLFLVMVISLKYNEDITHRNSYYANLAGITFEYLFKLERLVLELLSFKTFIDNSVFFSYERKFYSNDNINH